VTLSLNALQLCRTILGQQQLSVNADRAEIEAVLDARDEIDAAIQEATDQPLTLLAPQPKG
jgi:hypothetical protein